MKIFSRIMVGLLVTLSLYGLVNAQEEDTTTTSPTRLDTIKSTIETNVPYDTAKEKVLTLLDRVTTRLTTTQTNLGTRNLTPEVYAIVNQAMTDVLALLGTYKTDLAPTTTYDEMDALNKTLKENLTSIISTASFDVAEAQLAYFEEFQTEMDEYADALATVCPDQTELTDAITASRAELDAGITELETALAAEDLAATKTVVKDLVDIAEDIADNIEELEGKCLI